jgi:hypothetical protein
MDGFEKDTNKEEIAEKYYWEVGLFYFRNQQLWGIASKTDELHETE